jgi:phosphoglycerate dehydrogenase-like enzyme
MDRTSPYLDNRPMNPGAVINTDHATWTYVFSEQTRRHLHEMLEFDDPPVSPDLPEWLRASAVFPDVKVMLASWNSRPVTETVLGSLPSLQLIVYAAGSVKELITPAVDERGITVCSASHVNAQPVAEFTLGLILVALKQVHSFSARLRRDGPEGWLLDGRAFTGGYYGTRVGLLGYGRITERLIPLLQPFDITVLLNDPWLSEEQIAALGVVPASLAEIMESCDVVSLHHGNTPENRHMINADNLSLMKPGTTFINTSRGALIDEQALITRLRSGDITAYLDVTDPEPPPEGHPFYTLPNCVLTPHIAGSLGREVHRMGDFALREVRNWLAGTQLENPIDLSTIDRRA